jgi:cell division protein ZapA (FtsZ GTPase activity inhibitor)
MNVQINIRGRQFNIRTSDDSEAIQKMAVELDRRLNEQASRSRTVDEHSVAVITALNLMGELQLLRRQMADRLNDLDRDVQSVMALVETLIPEEGDAASGSETSSP